MLLGYSFEPRPNSRALGKAGSVMTRHFLFKKRMLHSENQSKERTRLTSSEALTRFRQSFVISYSLKKIKRDPTRTVTHRYMTS